MLKQILKVLIYIERHIDETMTLPELGKVAGYSPFHLHRLFKAVVGESIHQYIKRLRLEKAEGQLRYTDATITNIAFDINFETSSSFSKAFKQSTGRCPSHYRNLHKEIYAMSKKIDQIDTSQPDEITNLPEQPVFFVRRCGDYATSGGSAWEAMRHFIKQENLDPSKLRYFSIAHDNPEITDTTKLRFDACIASHTGLQAVGELSQQILPGGKFAIFIHHGSHDTLSETFNRIFSKWLPSNALQHDTHRIIFCELLPTTIKIFIPIC